MREGSRMTPAIAECETDIGAHGMVEGLRCAEMARPPQQAACRSACLAEAGLRIRLRAPHHVALFVRHAHELVADLGVGALLGEPQKPFGLSSEEFSAFHDLLCLTRIFPLRLSLV